MNNIDYITILICFLIIVPILMFAYPVSELIKEHFSNRRKALNFMGKDMPVSIIRKDKGAKLAYKGIMKFLEEEYQKSAELFEEALRLELCDENREFCFNWLSHCYSKLRSHEKYKEVRLRAVQALPTNDNVLMSYANCCADDGDFKTAEYYCSQALKYNPNNTFAYRALGFMAETKGEYRKAVEYFSTVLKINASDIDVIYEKAVCHAALEENETAQELMKQAVVNDIDNRYDNYRKKISDIRKINSGDLNEPQKESSLD